MPRILFPVKIDKPVIADVQTLVPAEEPHVALIREVVQLTDLFMSNTEQFREWLNTHRLQHHISVIPSESIFGGERRFRSNPRRDVMTTVADHIFRETLVGDQLISYNYQISETVNGGCDLFVTAMNVRPRFVPHSHDISFQP